MNALLKANGLRKVFNGVAVVDGVSLEVSAGATLALLGASGCGKTTTLKLLNRLIEPDTGVVYLAGAEARSVPAHLWRRRIGYVIQSAGLLPHRNVAENVGVTPQLLGWDKARIAEKVAAMLDLVGLESNKFADRMPGALSGGQRQRVGLARALAGEPELVLMDEPFAALDPVTKAQLIDDVEVLRARLGFAAVLVTHDFSEALRLADRIAVMDGGRIVQTGAPSELISQPATNEIRKLLAAPLKTSRAVAQAFDAAKTTS